MTWLVVLTGHNTCVLATENCTKAVSGVARHVDEEVVLAELPSELVLKSILGTPPQVIALINNHTFAPGEEGDVITKNGQRLHIRCVAINPSALTATVEANGTSATLTLVP